MLLDHEYQTYGTLLKYFIFTVNFVIWLLGGVLLVTGISVRVDGLLWEYTEALDIDRYNWACYLIMIVGTCLIMIAFIGCLGAAIESPLLLLLFLGVTAFCVILEIAASILVWRIPGGDQLQAVLSKDIEKHIDNMNTNWESRRFLDIMQLKLECCGAYTHMDYERKHLVKPVTCNSDRTNNIQIRSCGENLRRYLEVRGGIIGGVCMGLLLMQIFVVTFKSCLIWVMKETRNQMPNYKN